jgi:hypothetical protein
MLLSARLGCANTVLINSCASARTNAIRRVVVFLPQAVAFPQRWAFPPHG